MARVELKEGNMEQIVGGRMKFYSKDGENYVDVIGVGTYHTSADGILKCMNVRNANPGLSDEKYLEMFLDQGIVW